MKANDSATKLANDGITEARRLENTGQVASLANIRSMPVWIYSSSNDPVSHYNQ